MILMKEMILMGLGYWFEERVILSMTYYNFKRFFVFYKVYFYFGSFF